MGKGRERERRGLCRLCSEGGRRARRRGGFWGSVSVFLGLIGGGGVGRLVGVSSPCVFRSSRLVALAGGEGARKKRFWIIESCRRGPGEVKSSDGEVKHGVVAEEDKSAYKAGIRRDIEGMGVEA